MLAKVPNFIQINSTTAEELPLQKYQLLLDCMTMSLNDKNDFQFIHKLFMFKGHLRRTWAIYSLQVKLFLYPSSEPSLQKKLPYYSIA